MTSIALEIRHISHRYQQQRRQAGDEDLALDAPADARTWREERIQELSRLHSPLEVDMSEFLVLESTLNAVSSFTTLVLSPKTDARLQDLEVTLNSGSFQWTWNTMSAGLLSPEILSKHLIIPLITLSESSLKTATDIPDVTWSKVRLVFLLCGTNTE